MVLLCLFGFVRIVVLMVDCCCAACVLVGVWFSWVGCVGLILLFVLIRWVLVCV